MFNTTVDDILADFTVKVQKLRTIANVHKSKELDATETANAYKARAEDHKAESARALRVADKIQGLLD